MIENNQPTSRRGGARKNAGRKVGSATKKTREIADNAMAEGISPLEYILSVMRNELEEPRARLAAANMAAPYIHPRLSSIEMNASVTNHEAALDDLK